MAAFAFAFFTCMLAFIHANDVAENETAGMYTIYFLKQGNRCLGKIPVRIERTRDKFPVLFYGKVLFLKPAKGGLILIA